MKIIGPLIPNSTKLPPFKFPSVLKTQSKGTPPHGESSHGLPLISPPQKTLRDDFVIVVDLADPGIQFVGEDNMEYEPPPIVAPVPTAVEGSTKATSKPIASSTPNTSVSQDIFTRLCNSCPTNEFIDGTRVAETQVTEERLLPAFKDQ